jgi:HSP20 family protein
MRALTLRTPARGLSPLHRDFDDLLGRFFGNNSEWIPGVATSRWLPPLESFLRDGELVVRLDVPGVDREALDISVEGDRLTVKGERRASNENAEAGRTYREVVYGAFERSISLPWDVDPENVRAQCKDGVLEITMKAPEKTGAKKIEIAQ